MSWVISWLCQLIGWLGRVLFGGCPAGCGDCSGASQHFLCNRDDLVGFKAEFFLKFFEWRGSAEGVHADDLAFRADVTRPSEG